MPGPLPQPQRRRTNAPTIPTTKLPASGRPGPAPRPPKWITLGPAGAAWWKWAWRTPQAAAWSTGNLVDLAHRASLEDDLAALEMVNELDVASLLNVADEKERAKELEWLIRRLAAMATGRLAILGKMTDLDKVFGLTAKGMADLRWTIEADEAVGSGPVVAEGRWGDLALVDGA